jgi:hypothetical protein
MRPQQLDIRVPDGAHRRQRALRVCAHGISHRVQFQTDSVEATGRDHGMWRGADAYSGGGEGLNECPTVHWYLISGV